MVPFPSPLPKENNKMTSLRIKGMSCQHCVESTKKALETLPGIKDVVVDLKNGTARFEGEVERAAAQEAIDAIGFELLD